MSLFGERFADVGVQRTSDNTQHEYLEWKRIWWDEARQRERTPQEVAARAARGNYDGPREALRPLTEFEIQQEERKARREREERERPVLAEQARQQQLAVRQREAQQQQANIDFQIESVLDSATPAERGRIAQAVVNAGRSLNDPEAFRFALMEIRATQA